MVAISGAVFFARLKTVIERGIIAIDFDARTNLEGQGLRHHGTKFRVKPDDLRHLYSENKCFGF